MDARQSKRRKGSRGPIKSSQQSRASIEEVEDSQSPFTSVKEKKHRSRKPKRPRESAAVLLQSPSPEAEEEASEVASTSRSPIEAVGKRRKDHEHTTPLRKRSKKRKASTEAAIKSSKSIGLEEIDEDEGETVSHQADAAIHLQSSIDARIEALEEENARLNKELASKDGALEKQRDTISYIYGQCTCTVCMELVWRPHVLAPCGHVFCARCLVAWFSKPALDETVISQNSQHREQLERIRTLRRPKACPQCREKVTVAPVEVWLVKGLVDLIDKSMREGQGNDDHLVQGQESLAGLSVSAINEAKGVNLPASPAIWKDIFPNDPSIEPIYDEEDRIFRCAACTSEVVNGECTNPACDMLYDIDNAHLNDSESMLDDDYSDEYDDDHYEEDDLQFIDDGDDVHSGPIVIHDDTDDDGDDLVLLGSEAGNDYDSVIFASGSEADAIVISSESSDNDEEEEEVDAEDDDDEDAVEVEDQEEDEDADELRFIDDDDEDGLTDSSDDSFDQEL